MRFEKYGNETDAIDAITRAIHGEINALDDLAEKEYRKMLSNLRTKINIVEKNLTNKEVYNYGNLGEYSPDNLIFANNLISRITKNEADILK